MDENLEYLKKCIEAAKFTSIHMTGVKEDKNILAFRSKEEFISWYCQPPGEEGQSYRDRGFYTRELAMLSRIIKPKVVVEFGTCQGIGTCLLGWLNPTAKLVTVDINTETYIPGDIKVPIGYLAKLQNIKCEYITGNSWEYIRNAPVDLCFIDADHSYDAVLKDSDNAWYNRSDYWAIVWHDHNDRHPGVKQAVAEFCASVRVKLQSLPDSDTVWIMGEK